MFEALAFGGVNRASLGVQSFDPTVQRAINRVQSFEATAAATEGCLEGTVGAEGLNIPIPFSGWLDLLRVLEVQLSAAGLPGPDGASRGESDSAAPR